MKTFKEKRKERRKKRELSGRTKNTFWDVLIECGELLFDITAYIIPGVIRLFLKIFD